jgi:hypothetical protein
MGVFEAERLAEEERQRNLKQVAESVLALLEARGFEIDAADRDTILSCDDQKQAEGWLVRSATATSVQEVFAEPAGGH